MSQLKSAYFIVSHFGYFGGFLWTNNCFHQIFPYKHVSVIHGWKGIEETIFLVPKCLGVKWKI